MFLIFASNQNITQMKTSAHNLSNQILAVCYYRVSRNVQNDLRQENDVRDYCKNNGIIIAETFREKISGTKRLSRQDRPELAKCINYINEQNINLLVCSELSRLGRTPEVVHLIDEFTQKRICVISLKENIKTLDDFLRPVADQLLMVNIINGIALKESDTLSYRIRSGKRAAVLSRGAWTGGKFLPYGYFSKNGILTVEQDEAKIARDIFNKYNNGWGVTRIANWLNKNKIPTKLGKTWAYTTIRKILKHEIYAGVRRYDLHDVLSAPHLRIINEKTFSGVKLKLIENRKKIFDFNITKKYDVLLDKGLIRCGICGKVYSGIVSRNVYICSSSKYSAGCGNSCIRMKETEQAIQIFLLENYIRLLKTVSVTESKNDYCEAELRMLQQKQLNEKIKQGRYNEMYGSGRLNKIEYELRYNASAEQITLIRKNIDALKEKVKNHDKQEPACLISGELTLNMQTGRFDHVNASIKKSIIHQVIRQILVQKKDDKKYMEVRLIDDSSFKLKAGGGQVFAT